MSIRCDLHMLSMPGREAWRQQAVQSVKNEPVVFHLLPGILENIGEARWRGFSCGDKEFVTYVDDDDYIVPGIVQKLINALDENPQAAGAFSLFTRIDENGNKISTSHQLIDPTEPWKPNFGRYVHQMVIYRRDILFQYLPQVRSEKKFAEALLNLAIAQDHSFIQVPSLGYYWRIHSGCLHKNKNLRAYSNRKY